MFKNLNIWWKIGLISLGLVSLYVTSGEVAKLHPKVSKTITKAQEANLELSDRVDQYTKDNKRLGAISDSLSRVILQRDNTIEQLQTQNKGLLNRAVFAEQKIAEFHESGDKFCYEKVKVSKGLFKGKDWILKEVKCDE